MNDILYIALLSVYSVILIVITLKAPSYMSKIKQRIKTRKKQKQTQLKKLVRQIVREYLEELSDG